MNNNTSTFRQNSVRYFTSDLILDGSGDPDGDVHSNQGTASPLNGTTSRGSSVRCKQN